MHKITTHQEYQELCRKIWDHNRRYYVDHNPIITDEQFDHLYKRLEDVEKAHPEWIDPTSPTQRVCEALTQGFASVTHRTPMPSLRDLLNDVKTAFVVFRKVCF